MVRHTQRDGGASGGYLVGHACGAFDDERERAGPELLRECVEQRRRVIGERPRHFNPTDVNDEWIPVGTFLCGEDFPDGVGVERVGAEAVHGFRWKRDESARAKHPGGALDGVAGRYVGIDFEDRAFHDWQDKRVCYDGRAKMKNTAILLVDCPDQKGIVATISDFLYRHNANIIHADQNQDPEMGLFLTRVEWDLA